MAAPPQPVWPARPPSLCSAACVHGLRGGPSRSTPAVGRSRERVSASCRGKTRPPAFRSAAWGCAASAFPPGHPGSDTWGLPRIRGVPFPDGFYLLLKGSEKSQIQFKGYFSSFYSPPRAVPRNVRASLLGFSVLCVARGPCSRPGWARWARGDSPGGVCWRLLDPCPARGPHRAPARQGLQNLPRFGGHWQEDCARLSDPPRL